MTTSPAFTFAAERSAAVRMALGIALSHTETAKLSNAALARAIGCGETTVRRYRKIASAAGLVGVVKAGPAPVVCRVPDSKVEAAGRMLSDAFSVTSGAHCPLGKKLFARTKALTTLLYQIETVADVEYVYQAAMELEKQSAGLGDDWLD